jgi:membrane protein implicated in regulation of membrane protease activity
MEDWVWWVVAALGLAVIEIATLDLIFIMLAAGAAAGAVTAALGGPVVLQVIVAAVVSLAMLGLVRPIALNHLRQPAEIRTGVAALVGARAVVVEAVGRDAGLVKLAGELWTARGYDPSRVIEVGREVDVVRIDGATAVVLESD